MVKKKSEELKVLSEILTRMSYLSGLGKSFGGKRDLYAECGFPKVLGWNDFYSRYKRQGVAKVVVDVYPKMTWKNVPEVKDNEMAELSEFEKRWRVMVDEKKIFYFLTKADRLSGIGRFGILVIGFDDGKELEKPCEKASDILFLQSYGEGDVSIVELDEEPISSRFGLPVMYKVFVNRADGKTISKNIHWTRVIHLAEDCESSEIYGTPRMESCYNDLMSLEQLIGGGAEMYWKGAFPGYNFKVDSNAEMTSQSLSAVKEEIEKLMHGLQRYIRTKGISAEALPQQVSDPSSFIDILLRSISISKRIPKRILEGSERGELASNQDKETWLEQIAERQKNYAEPFILRPFIDRLISKGVLPVPYNGTYKVEWPVLIQEDALRKADVALKKTQAVAAYSNSPNSETIIPVKSFLTRILDFTEEEVKSFQKEVEEDQISEIQDEKGFEEE